MRVSTLDRQYKISQSTAWLYPPPPSLPPPEFFLVLATKLTKKRQNALLKWNLAELFGLYGLRISRKSWNFAYFRIFSWNRENLHRPIKNKLITARLLPPKFSNQSNTVIYRVQSHDNMVASSWCTAITSDYIYTFYSWLWYVRCTFSKTILYKRLTTIFSGAGRQFLIVFFLSFAGIVRGEEGVSLQSFGNRRPRCWKN